MLCVASLSVNAQVTVEQSIDSLQILIGEQTRLHLKVSMKDGQRASLPYYKNKQMLVPGVEVLGQNDADTVKLDNGMVQVERTYTLTSFDEKVYAIPALTVKVSGKSYHGNVLALKVISVPVDTAHAEKFYIGNDATDSLWVHNDVQDNPFLWSEWSGIFWFSMLAVVLILLLVYFVIRLRQNKPIIVKLRVVKRIPAHDKALNAIEAIKVNKHTDNQEGLKEYYTSLTDTLREYIVNRFGFNAMEMTSSEIIERLRNTGDQKMIDELKELFQTADLVKFAKYETLINENDANLVNAVKFIDETKTDEVEKEEKVAPALSETDMQTRQNRKVLKTLISVLVVGTVALMGYIIYQLYLLMC